MRTKAARITFAFVPLLLLSTTAFAKPQFLKQYAAYYKGSTSTCQTCHSTPPKLNPYGAALKAALKRGKSLTPAMFKATEGKRPTS